MLFCHLNSYFDIRTDSDNRILTFAQSRKIVFWHSRSYFDIRTASEYPILTFNILFLHSHCVRISYFDIQNPSLTLAPRRKIVFCHSNSYCNIRTEQDNPILTIKILSGHSRWIRISYFDIQNPIWTFALSPSILFWHSKSNFDIRTEAENRILTFSI